MVIGGYWWLLVVLGGSWWFLVFGRPTAKVLPSFQTKLPCFMTLGCAMYKRISILASDTLISQSDDMIQ